LAKLAGLTVLATASRPETVKWVLGLGADGPVDHRKPLPAQLADLGHREVDYIANFANTDQYRSSMAEMIKPQGHIVSIVENSQPVEIGLLKSKSASFHWTFMFTRSMFHRPWPCGGNSPALGTLG
jgi:NADPH2:quinone reductase